jgi:hypothetical protein
LCTSFGLRFWVFWIYLLRDKRVVGVFVVFHCHFISQHFSLINNSLKALSSLAKKEKRNSDSFLIIFLISLFLPDGQSTQIWTNCILIEVWQVNSVQIGFANNICSEGVIFLRRIFSLRRTRFAAK